eukprot:TRINITY_DN13318_c0_g1_i1.p1 TRINITY_DN13318_c0_g1~~TRINITY_DN13318_c0_g1_i1.p1  ORF type:complete len:191 (+),score=33.57 TRINITY_DN13318_c0_g1_i1:62-574(+)
MPATNNEVPLCPDSPDECPPLMLEEGIELGDDLEAMLDQIDDESEESISTSTATTTTLNGSEANGVPLGMPILQKPHGFMFPQATEMLHVPMMPFGAFMQPGMMNPYVNFVPVNQVNELNQLGMLPTVTGTPIENPTPVAAPSSDSRLGLNVQAKEFKPQPAFEGIPLWS